MADDTTQGGSDIIASDHVATYNGAVLTPGPTTPKVQRVKIGYGEDNEYRDAGYSYPLPMILVTAGSNIPASTQVLSTLGASTLAGSTSTTAAAIISLPLSGSIGFQLSTSAFVGTVSFEQSFDPTGANGTWVPMQCATSDGATAPSTSLAISTAAAYVRVYSSGTIGSSLFRIRVSAFTSGTLTATIKVGAGWYDPSPSIGVGTATIGTVLEPVRTNVTMNYTSTAPVVADTLLTVALNKGGTASSVTTVPVTAGKTLRITAVMVNLRATAATLPYGLVTLRVNYSGAAVIGSAAAAVVAVSGTAATAGNTGTTPFTMGDGILDLTGAAQIGVSFSNNVTSNVANISLIGYEF